MSLASSTHSVHPLAMSAPAYAIATIAAVLSVVCLLVLRKTIRRLNDTRREKEDILSEELRMFDFLHHLGQIIGEDVNHRHLYREIVEGFRKVLGADGGALYLLSDDQKNLAPQYISKNCPALVGVPVEIRNRARRDPRAQESYVRLAKVPVDAGLLGTVLASGECLLLPNVKDHDSFRDAFVSYEEEITALIAPLRYGGRDIGVVATVRQHASESGQFTANDFEVFRSAAEQSAFAMGNAITHLELVEKRKLADEVQTASEVQNILLPSGEPVIPGYRVSGKNTPARMISGDYFDYIDLENNSTGIVIADVTGKGVPAGLLMAMCRSVLRMASRISKTPSAALAQVNRNLFPDVREDMFVSLAYVVLQHGTGELCLARAGHDAPLMFRSGSGELETIKPPGLAIGIDEGEVFERVTKDLELRMESGDCLLLYTDGVCEAVDGEETEFGKQRLDDVFLQSAPLGADAVVQAIHQAVGSFVGDEPQMDDITMIVIEKR